MMQSFFCKSGAVKNHAVVILWNYTLNCIEVRKPMQAIITIFESELLEKDRVVEQLMLLCEDVKQVTNALVFAPIPGKLFELLTILRDNRIEYRAHFA